MDRNAVNKLLHEISKNVYFDDTKYLREQTSNPDEVIKFIEELLRIDYQNNDEYFILSTLGYCYRIINCPLQSIACYEKCLNLLEEDDSRYLATIIRLGESYKYDSQYTRTIKLFEHAEVSMRTYNHWQYEDYIYQHFAKCYLEMGNTNLAKKYALKALEIRKVKNNKELILSTQKILELI